MDPAVPALAWGNSGNEAKLLGQFRRLLSKTNEKDQRILLFMVPKMAGTHRAKA